MSSKKTRNDFIILINENNKKRNERILWALPSLISTC